MGRNLWRWRGGLILALAILVMGTAAVAQTWPRCVSGCQANDLTVTSLWLVAPVTCTPGTPVSAELWARFEKNTQSERDCVVFVGDIYVNGALYQLNFWKRVADVFPAGQGTYDFKLTDITWTCGYTMEVRNILIFWSTKGPCNDTCANTIPSKCYASVSGLMVEAPLVANFSHDAPKCDCNTIQFTDKTTGGTKPYTYNWQFGDGASSTAANPSHHYAGPGTYNVTLTVTDSSSPAKTDSETKTVTIWANPVANFSATPVSGCAPLVVRFTDASTSGSPNGGTITKWEWDFNNDGTVDRTDTSPPGQFTRTYNTPGTYSVRLRVTDSNGCTHTLVRTDYITVQDCCVPPSITTHPQSQTVCAGSSVTFSVEASGTAPLSYQWKKDGTDISGATSANYTISSVTTGHAGSYTVVVSNACGSVTSNAATLTVNTPPLITAQPQSQTVCAGNTATFSVVATGTGLSYQWQVSTDDGSTWSDISGATSDSYTTPSLTAADNGKKFRVVVTGTCGSVTSDTATLTILGADVQITKTHSPDPVVAGRTLTYTLLIQNNGPCSATNVVVTDTLPSEITEAKYMVNGTPQGDWTGNYTIDTLEPGLTVTITITGKVAPWATETLTNTATARVTSGTYDPDDKNNTATSTTTVEIQADISVTKKVSPTIAKPGDTITYTIEVTNNGPSDAPNVVVTDTLPQYITGATYEVDGTDKGNWTGSYTIGRMKPGDTVTITITGTVSSGASGTLTNTVVVELKPAQVGGQAGNDPEPGNNEDTATIIFAFYTGFEGWVSNGLWYIRRDNGGCFRCDKIQGEYVQFAKLEDCISRTYNLGTSRAYGVLTSPVIRPPAGATGWVMISIDFYRQVEKERPTGDYDRTYVQLSINGGSWQTIWSRSSRNGSEECGTITYVIQSMPKYFQIRFIFDSVDYRYNNYKGWAIDNVWAAVVPVGTQAKGEELLAGDLTSELTVINVPNPITDVHTTTFKVLGPLADSVERIRVRIFDLSGKLVWEGETAGNALEWHTTDFLGRYLANGVYLYQVQVYVGGTWITSDLQKLAIYR